jgi:pSer/pThr/pTyr-binding forkhead associated (FHA) protein
MRHASCGRSDLHTQLWPEAFVSDATLAGLVKEIRRVLRQDGGAPIIRTSHGVGYGVSGVIERPPRPLTDRWLISLGRRHALKLGDNVIGRDPSADVWLSASGVSRRHARIVVTPDGSFLHDLGSKNGTRLRGVLLSSTADLTNGDLITIGPFAIVYGSGDSPDSTETLAS